MPERWSKTNRSNPQPYRHIAIVVVSLCWCSSYCAAQNSSIFRPTASAQPQPGLPQPGGPELLPSVPSDGWHYVPIPLPKKVAIHDMVVVRVDEIARMQSDGEVNRRKTSTLNARLQDWILLRGLEAIKPDPQPDGDQRIQGQLQQQLRSTNELEAREALAFTIACEVVDIRPNGNLVLEGHKRVGINEETWEVSLSGLCRREDIGPDNILLSRNILDLRIDKRERGIVRDGYRRGWFQRWFDEFQPF